MKATVTFRTNDPATPQATVQALIPKIIGGVIARPPTIAFGAVPLKHDARRMIEIYDNRTPTRRVAKVLSAWPARVTARYLSSNDAIGPSLGVGSKAVLIGRVELVANSRQPGPLDSEILIHLAGEPCPPDVIRVTGRVADVVVVAPMSLVLPRQSAQGLLYFGDCLCGSSEGKQLVITPDSVPPELTVSITAVKGNPSLQRVRIEWHPAEIKAGGNEPSRLVRLRAKIADQEKLVDIPVYLSSPPRGRT